MAQGPYKRVPTLTADELRVLFRHGPDRHHFLIKRIADGQPLGRFYYRAWRFGGEPGGVDSQLNIFLADPCERGKGYGTAVSNWSSTTCWRVTTHGASVLTPL